MPRTLYDAAEEKKVEEGEVTEEKEEVDLGEISEYPKNEQRKAVIKKIEKTELGPYFRRQGVEDLKYGDPSDRILVIHWETDDEDKFQGSEMFNFPEGKLTDRHKLGKYKQRYGNPKKGDQISVDFDADGNPSVIL